MLKTLSYSFTLYIQVIYSTCKMLTLPVAHRAELPGEVWCPCSIMGGGGGLRSSRIPHFVAVYLDLIRDISTVSFEKMAMCVSVLMFETLLLCFSFEP